MSTFSMSRTPTYGQRVGTFETPQTPALPQAPAAAPSFQGGNPFAAAPMGPRFRPARAIPNPFTAVGDKAIQTSFETILRDLFNAGVTSQGIIPSSPFGPQFAGTGTDLGWGRSVDPWDPVSMLGAGEHSREYDIHAILSDPDVGPTILNQMIAQLFPGLNPATVARYGRQSRFGGQAAVTPQMLMDYLLSPQQAALSDFGGF